MSTPTQAGKGPQPRPYNPTAFEIGYQRIRGFRQNETPAGPCPICGDPGCMGNECQPYDMDDIDLRGDDEP